MILYIAEISTDDQMASVGEEERQEIIKLWMDWYTKPDSTILEMGSPIGKGKNLAPVGSTRSRRELQVTPSCRLPIWGP